MARQVQGIEFWKLGKKIAGAGLNYKQILAERNLPIPKEPVVFLKPTSSYILEGQSIEIPQNFTVNEEIELGVLIGKACKNIKPSQVKNYITGYCLALDLTAINILGEAREKGLPWAIGKGFDTSCPVSKFIPCKDIPDPDNVSLWCRINGELCQDANTSDMVFSVGELVSYISQFMTLEPYDLILTGTPAGTRAIKPGDVIEGGLESIVNFKFPVKST